MHDIFNENTIRLSCFLGVLMAMAAWERLAPRKKRVDSIQRRWVSNIGLAALDTLAVKIIFPLLPVSFSMFAASKGWGLFNLLEMPEFLEWVAAVVLLDFIIYGQHVMFHFVPALWRLHRVHHSDLDIDASTGIRFHPAEIIISMFIKLAAVGVFGFPAGAVLIFEMLLNATSLFNHANIFIPHALDGVLRRFIVTPDMHRVHHSVIVKESDMNFGFNLPWWDRICGTYQAQPAGGHDRMAIGLQEIRRPLSFAQLLMMPFAKR
ncbi:MAG: sterol desaturase family protein [Desulfobacterales bacterium]|jgi:sterol desaturase/sphingolipid hydroxylase (fatty acid hydroxylase superfamily)|nr:sterol desaturase family protein [Desulfobacterales bacterium]